MKYISKHKIFIIFLTLMWCILCGNFSLINLIQGVFLASFSVFISCHMPGSEQYLHTLNISFINFLKFIIVLLIDIYKSTFIMIKLIFTTSKLNPKLVTIQTSLNNDWAIFFLANAITLTPGTVTVNRTDNKLLILTINSEKSDNIINKSIVNALSKGVKS